MSNNTERDHFEPAGLSTDQELSQLIGAVMATKKSNVIHPAKAFLDVLETNVEPQAREMAGHEIAAIASQIQLAASAARPASPPTLAEEPELSLPDPSLSGQPLAISNNPFAPQASAPEAAPQDAPAAVFETEALAPDMAVHRPQVDIDELAIPSFGYQAPEEGFEPETVETDWQEAAYYETEEAPLVAPALASGDNGWFGHSQDGLPIWMTAGIPVAAVSVFALGFAFMDRPDTTALTVAAAAPTQTHVQSAALPAPTPEPAAVDSVAAIPAEAALEPAPQTVPVSQTQTLPPIASTVVASSVIVTVPETVEEVAETPFASVPSVKPSYPKIAQSIVQSNAPIAAVVRAPSQTRLQARRTLPVRMFTGRIEAGSAASLATAAIEQTGTALPKSEKLWLARDMERALDNEIDGRTVSLKARSGGRVRLALKTSQQVQRSYTISRAKEMGSLPHNIVLEGGWYAAKRDLVLHATPSLNTGMSHRTVKQDALIERMGTYTDRYGDRWYLMGQRGLAVGFLSAADVVLAEVHDRPFGDVYYAAPGARISETRVVYTNCRDGFVGPEGGLSSHMQVCRNAEGHWIEHTQGKVSVRQASLVNTLLPNSDTASAIVLAEATGDPVTYHAFGNRMFRRRLQGDFVHARFGQTTEQTLPNGDPIKFTFGKTYEEQGPTPLVRVAALGPLSSKVRIKAGFMKAPIGAKIRAMPDMLSTAELGEIPAGRAVETIGLVEGLRGEDWMLVGRSGIGFGYVPVAKLAEIEGRVSPYAIKNVRQSATTAELVEATRTCRSVTYQTFTGNGSFDACQQADGSWSPKLAPGRQFAEGGPSDTLVAP